VAALQAFGQVRTSEDLNRNQAVYQDLTREVLVKRGYRGNTISPEEAGQHLVNIAGDYDFTLFEYFQTDLMAHRGTEDDVRRVLADVDRLLTAVLPLWSQPGHLFILTSDHGNVEDLRHRRHTDNPVPFVAIGQGAERLWEDVVRLEDVVPALLHLYPALEDQGIRHDLG
jgi:bisphosphoglycerate-independent phosphoglycerate mutase (AlkP superfamily)